MLKPCPFCGSSRLTDDYEPSLEPADDGVDVDLVFVLCETCGATGPRQPLDAGHVRTHRNVVARTAWNERAEVATS